MMYKLLGTNVDGSVRLEQVFQDYVALKSKQVELIGMGLITVITPMTALEHEAHSEILTGKLIGLYGNSIVN